MRSNAPRLARLARRHLSTPGKHIQQERSALKAVNTALVGNGCILGSKALAYLFGGSSSMLAECIHSSADIANQYLLRVGSLQSMKKPDSSFNYGYRREKFVWSLVSAVGIFCVGSGVSVLHGVHSLLQPHPVEHLWESIAVLGTSFVVESYSLSVALKSISSSARAQSTRVREHILGGGDPTAIAIVAEDASAVLGLVFAGGALAFSEFSGMAAFDSGGSILVGTLLGVTAAFLIQLNRRSLLGRSLSQSKMHKLVKHIQADPVVKEVFDAKSEQLGPQLYRFKVEVEWDGSQMVQRFLADLSEEERERLCLTDDFSSKEAVDRALLLFGKHIVSKVGDEVDRLENEIRSIDSRVQHIDIESN